VNTTNRILDRLAARFSLTSDYGLSKLLNVTRGAVSSWRNEKSGMAEDVAIRAAMLLDEDAGPLLAELRAERADTDEARKTWKQIAGRLRRSAAAILAGIVILGMSHNDQATATTLDSAMMEKSQQNQECILR
jgi:predicted transcriptional regulator